MPDTQLCGVAQDGLGLTPAHHDQLFIRASKACTRAGLLEDKLSQKRQLLHKAAQFPVYMNTFQTSQAEGFLSAGKDSFMC